MHDLVSLQVGPCQAFFTGKIVVEDRERRRTLHGGLASAENKNSKHLLEREISMPVRKTTKASPPQLMHAQRLIVASNRGPVEFQLTQDKTLKARRGSGGMVTALIDTGNRMA